MAKIDVKGSEITVVAVRDDDYISLTDMARHKNQESTGLVISHWLSTRYTVEFIGVWERLNNPDFNVTEFSNIRNESGSNGFVQMRLLTERPANALINSPQRRKGRKGKNG